MKLIGIFKNNLDEAKLKGAFEIGAKRVRGQMQEMIFQRLRNGLMAGHFTPGQAMSLRKLAEQFGTSPMPVREALSRLVVVNALEESPSHSVCVPRPTPTRMAEIFEVRELLEGRAAEAACRNCTPTLVASLTSVNDKLLAAIAARNLQACLSWNQRFHFTLYDAADSEILMPLIESLWLQFGPTMYLSLLQPETPWDASAHLDILEGLRTNSPSLTKRGVVKDIRTTGGVLIRALAGPNLSYVLPSFSHDLYFGR